jgi:hypothetical protein
MTTNYDQSLPIAFRKENGVFYTQELVASYIIEQSIGSYWLENQSFEALQTIKVLDNACGEGIFLCQAFLFLQKLYQIHFPAFPYAAEHIIRNNLFGVDIDGNSVALTQKNLQAISGVALDLSPNIKQGNSLIDDKTVTEWAFDWQQAFPFQFDVVVGNPPYGALLPPSHVAYYKEKYQSAEYQINSYVLFYEKSLGLLKDNGYLGFITPNTFTYQHYFSKIRSIFNDYCIKTVSKNTFQVFPDANIGDTVNWIMKKAPQTATVEVAIYENIEEFGEKSTLIPFASFRRNDNTYNTGNKIGFDKLCLDCESLGNLAQITVGIKAYQEGKGEPKQTKDIVSQKPYSATNQKDKTYLPCIVGKDFHRYNFLEKPSLFLSYGKWLAEPRETAPFFEPEKIIIRQTADSLICHLDTFQYINLNNVYNVGRVDDRLSIRYLLGLLNSNLLNYIYQDIAQEKGKLFAEVKKIYLEKLPIKVASPEEQQVIAEKVNQLLQHYKALSKVRIDLLELLESNFSKDKFTKKLENWFLLDWAAFYQEIEKIGVKMSLKKQKEWKEFFDEEQTTARHNYQAIQTLEKSINELVYQLYNLTTEEIAWIENDK